MADYEIRIQDASGNTLLALDQWQSLDYARTVNNVGALTLRLPPTLALTYFKRDGRIFVYRSIPNMPPRIDLQTYFLITRVQQVLTEQGERYIEIGAMDAMHLLKRRIVAYAAGSSQAVKSAAADDLMKAIVRENLSSSATDTSRQLAASLFSVTANTSQAPTVAKAFSRRTVLDVLRDVADASATAGTYLAFDVVWNGTGLEFRTYTKFRGVDHRYPSGTNPVLLSAEAGSLTRASYQVDYTDEVTVAYAGGQGEGTDRVVASSIDTTRATLSPFARCESWQDARQNTSSTAVQDEADAALRAGRPRITFDCTVNADAPGALYGRDYGFGDVVTAQAFGQSVDCRVDGVRVTVTPDSETVAATLRSVT